MSIFQPTQPTPSNIWSKQGTTLMTIQAKKPDGENWIKMSSLQPSAIHIAQNDGTWTQGPEESIKITPLQFVEKFTLPELDAIYLAAESNRDLQIWLDKSLAATFINFGDQSLLEGMAFLVFQGLLTQLRHDEILEVQNA